MALRFFAPSVATMLDKVRANTALDDAARAAAVRDAVDALVALPTPQRVRAAGKLDVYALARDLGSAATPLFRTIVDDDVLRDRFGNNAVGAWLSVTLDRKEAATRAVAHLREWHPGIGLRALAVLDEGEAFDILAPLFEHDAELRRRYAADDTEPSGRPFRDPRWVDVALRLLAVDVVAAVCVLRLNATVRADEEMDGILERATRVDDAVIAVFDALQHGPPFLDADESHPRIQALARFLSRDAAWNIAETQVSFMVSTFSTHLHEIVVDDVARQRIAACQRSYAFVVSG